MVSAAVLLLGAYWPNTAVDYRYTYTDLYNWYQLPYY